MIDVVGEGPVGAVEPVGHGHFGERRGLVLFEHGGHRHQLACGARLVGVLDGGVAEGVGVRTGDVVGVEAGGAGHGEELTAAGVLDDDIAAVGVGLGDPLADGLLRRPLDVAVEGELYVGAGTGRMLAFAGGGDLPAAGLGVGDLAVLAREFLVQQGLDARAALAVGVDEPEDGGGQFAVGVDALGVLLAVDAGEYVRGLALLLRRVGLLALAHRLGRLRGDHALELLDLLPCARCLLPCEEHVAGVLLRQLPGELLLVLAQDGREKGGGQLGGVAIPVCLRVKRYGSAVTSYASTVVARAVPSREEIVPRSAASGTVM